MLVQCNATDINFLLTAFKQNPGNNHYVYVSYIKTFNTTIILVGVFSVS
jgi:hypothetical protein